MLTNEQILGTLGAPRNPDELNALAEQRISKETGNLRSQHAETMRESDDQQRLKAVRAGDYGTLESGRTRHIAKLKALDQRTELFRQQAEKDVMPDVEKCREFTKKADASLRDKNESKAFANHVLAADAINKNIPSSLVKKADVFDLDVGNKEKEAAFLRDLQAYAHAKTDEQKAGLRDTQAQAARLMPSAGYTGPRMDRHSLERHKEEFRQLEGQQQQKIDDGKALSARIDEAMRRRDLANTQAGQAYAKEQRCRKELAATLGDEHVTQRLVTLRMEQDKQPSRANSKAYNTELAACATRSLEEARTKDAAHVSTVRAQIKKDYSVEVKQAVAAAEKHKSEVKARFDAMQERKGFWGKVAEKITGRDRKSYDTVIGKIDQKLEQKVQDIKEKHSARYAQKYESEQTRSIEKALREANQNVKQGRSADPIPKTITPGEGDQPWHRAGPEKAGSYTRQPNGDYMKGDKVGFTDRGNVIDLSKTSTTPEVNMAAKVASEKNWRSVDVSNVAKSDPGMARQIAVEASARNMEVKGHKMSPEDQQAASVRRAGLEQSGAAQTGNMTAREMIEQRQRQDREQYAQQKR